jgi:hypothetical protein
MSFLDRKRKNNPDKIVMKDYFFKLIFSKLGPLVKAGISLAIGKIVVFLASYGIMLDADLQLQLEAVITSIVWLAIDQLVNNYAGKHAEAIQKALGVKRDRWIGDKTVAAAEAKRPIEILD